MSQVINIAEFSLEIEGAKVVVRDSAGWVVETVDVSDTDGQLRLPNGQLVDLIEMLADGQIAQLQTAAGPQGEQGMLTGSGIFTPLPMQDGSFHIQGSGVLDGTDLSYLLIDDNSHRTDGFDPHADGQSAGPVFRPEHDDGDGHSLGLIASATLNTPDIWPDVVTPHNGFELPGGGENGSDNAGGNQGSEASSNSGGNGSDNAGGNQGSDSSSNSGGNGSDNAGGNQGSDASSNGSGNGSANGGGTNSQSSQDNGHGNDGGGVDSSNPGHSSGVSGNGVGHGAHESLVDVVSFDSDQVVTLSGKDKTFDSTDANAHTGEGIDIIDASNGAHQTISLSLGDILNIVDDDHHLTIMGGKGDVVNLVDEPAGSWSVEVTADMTIYSWTSLSDPTQQAVVQVSNEVQTNIA